MERTPTQPMKPYNRTLKPKKTVARVPLLSPTSGIALLSGFSLNQPLSTEGLTSPPPPCTEYDGPFSQSEWPSDEELQSIREVQSFYSHQNVESMTDGLAPEVMEVKVEYSPAESSAPMSGVDEEVIFMNLLPPPPPAPPSPKPHLSKGELGRFSIGNDRFASVRKFKGETRVDVREFTNGEIPTRKGISLTPSRWAMFRRSVSALEEQLASEDQPLEGYMGIHLGGFVYAKANAEYRTIDIRQYFIPKNERKQIPTKKGITLRHFEWNCLKSRMEDLTNLSPNLMNATPCGDDVSHSNQMGWMNCRECNPSGDTVC